jgi:hypothetical protein
MTFLKPVGFDSFTDLASFILAKDFYLTQDEGSLALLPPPNRLESLANLPLFVVQEPIDQVVTNIKKPIAAVIILVVGGALWTLYCYPNQSLEMVQKICLPVHKVEVWVIKTCLYAFGLLQINCLWLRTIFRLNNSTLREAWSKRQIAAVHIGSVNKS